jgi:hypothetical protein
MLLPDLRRPTFYQSMFVPRLFKDGSMVMCRHIQVSPRTRSIYAQFERRKESIFLESHYPSNMEHSC